MTDLSGLDGGSALQDRHFARNIWCLRKDVTGQYLIKSHCFLLLESGAHRPSHRAEDEDEDGFMYRYRHPRSPEREQLGDDRKGG